MSQGEILLSTIRCKRVDPEVQRLLFMFLTADSINVSEMIFISRINGKLAVCWCEHLPPHCVNYDNISDILNSQIECDGITNISQGLYVCIIILTSMQFVLWNHGIIQMNGLACYHSRENDTTYCAMRSLSKGYLFLFITFLIDEVISTCVVGRPKILFVMVINSRVQLHQRKCRIHAGESRRLQVFYYFLSTSQFSRFVYCTFGRASYWQCRRGYIFDFCRQVFLRN